METNETLGGNLLLAVSMVSGALDDSRREMLSKIRPDDWIPAETYLEFIRDIESKNPDKLRMIGRSIMYAGKSTFMADVTPFTPINVLRFIATSYERNNRGPSIGYWKLVTIRDGYAELETTDYSGENFVEGILEGAVRASGGMEVKVEKRKARSRGDTADFFAVSWEDQ